MEQLGTELQMIPESSEPLIYKRHPFVYMVEAADDICYRVIDMEDAQRLGILSADTVADYFFSIMKSINRPGENIDKTYGYYKDIEDRNEGIAFLRAKLINLLALQATDVFMDYHKDVLNGTFNDTLIDYIERDSTPLKEMMKLSVEKIYNHDTVTQIEIAGYNVMSELRRK